MDRVAAVVGSWWFIGIQSLLLLGWAWLNLTAWTVYTGTPGLVIAGIPALLHTSWHRVTIAGWGGLAYSSLLSLVAAYVFWNRGLARLGAGDAPPSAFDRALRELSEGDVREVRRYVDARVRLAGRGPRRTLKRVRAAGGAIWRGLGRE